jgi:hypothetical protein
MTKSKKQPDDVRIKSRKDIGKLRKAVDAYKKDTVRRPLSRSIARPGKLSSTSAKANRLYRFV